MAAAPAQLFATITDQSTGKNGKEGEIISGMKKTIVPSDIFCNH